ncbi:MAG: IS21-like element helper ATPase IstB, partial [Anaerolineae bacterium]
MIAVSELSSILKRLRLSGILETLDLRNQQAIAEHWTHVEFLGRLALDEVERRGGKQLDLRLRRGLVDTA